jgi:hypothetical protein
MNNIYELFYKIIENPRCIKYYEDLINYYESIEKKELYKKILEKIKNEPSSNDSE